MKISKLIKELEKYPEDADVFFEKVVLTIQKDFIEVKKVDLDCFDIIVEQDGVRISGQAGH